MANYRAAARRAALRYGLDPAVFQRQIGAESGFDPNALSPAGAVGIAQFMPGTARGVGVNPRDPLASLNAAAKLMAGYVRKYGSYRNALVAYNAGPGRVGGPLPGETQRYIAKILGGSSGQIAPRGGGGGGAGGGASSALISAGAGGGGGGVPMGSEGLAPLLRALTEQRSAPSSGGLASPAFSAQAALPQGYQLPASGGGPAPKPDVSALLRVIQTVGGDVGGGGVPGASAEVGLGGVSGAPGGLRGGRVTVAPGADRAGVRTNAGVVRFVKEISSIYGRPLMIGTGSNHSRLTVNGNVSAHWSGRAADVPLRGRALIRAGQDALIAAGMSPARARRQTGGLFNVGGWQVIFNTHIGGDHTNHLHVGMRSR